MNNIDIFSVFGKIVLALGGAGAIIVAVSGFIARLWAKWFMEKQKNKKAFCFFAKGFLFIKAGGSKAAIKTNELHRTDRKNRLP